MLDEEALLTTVVVDCCIPGSNSCRFLCCGDADVYRVITAARNFYLKIYRPPKLLELTEAEALFVWALSKSGISVVRPAPRKDSTFGIKDLDRRVSGLCFWIKKPGFSWMRVGYRVSAHEIQFHATELLNDFVYRFTQI